MPFAIWPFVERLRRNWSVIAFRSDRLAPTPLPDQVGRQLGLPGSPANVLAAISEGHECALVIDQLDAVSFASGRSPDFFLCRFIAQAARPPVPDELLEVVSWYGTSDPDPERELWRTEASRSQPYYGGDILMAAINSTRGSVASAIADLMRRDVNVVRRLLPVIEQMVHDPSIGR